MSERKVLNKYYPPDFDPSKIPRMKCSKNRQFTVRLMAPFNMRCATCGEYIYKGKKFNAKKEDVEGDDYLGIRIFRFYIKCTRCLQEISFKTDPKNTDYEIEAGATRNFMALKLAEEQADKEEEERKEEEASNPMKLLENRTKQSKHELELLESLEELKDLNKRHQNIDFDSLLSQFSTREAQQKLLHMQEEEDERYIKSVFGKRTVVEEEIINEESANKKKKKSRKNKTEHKELIKTNEILIDEEEERNSERAPPPSAKEKSLMTTIAAPLKVQPADSSKTPSLGVFKRSNLNNLVKLKTSENMKNVIKVEPCSENQKESTSGNNNDSSLKKSSSSTPSTSALSMLGAYSGSESGEDSN